jgi:thioredoxin 2
MVVVCPQCQAKNRIAVDKDGVPKCGRCHHLLPAPAASQPAPDERLTLRCGQCHAKNRVPAAKLHAGAKCGRCGAPLQHEEVLSGRPVLVTDANFTQTVLQSPLPVLLYAWAPWCSVCSGTGPAVDQLAAETKGKVRVGKVNIDANPALANQYNILSVPSFFIFDAGQLKDHLVGGIPKHDLMMKMAAYL